MQKGFVPIVPILIIAALIVGIGATIAYFKSKSQPKLPTKITHSSEKPQPVAASPVPSAIPSAQNHGTSPGSGINVKVYCVDKIDKVPCKGGVIVKDTNGREVLRAESDENGNLTHYLDPGDYTVEALTSPASGSCAGFALPPSSPPYPLCTNSYPVKIVNPNKITVSATSYTQVTVTYWTGRR